MKYVLNTLIVLCLLSFIVSGVLTAYRNVIEVQILQDSMGEGVCG